MALEIFAYGYGDILQTALNAIAAVVKDNNFKLMTRTAVALYLVWTIWRTVHSRFEPDVVDILKKLALMMLAVMSLTEVKYTMIVTDRTKPALSGIVDNVPAAVALPLWFSNRAEYVITKTFETAFSIPDGVSYNTVGYAGGVKNLRDLVYYVRIDNVYLRQSLISYYKNCVFAALYDGKIGADQVRRDKTENIISTVASLEPSRITVYYDKDHPNGQNLTCQDAAPKIISDIDNDKDNVFDKVAKIMGLDTTTLSNYAQGELSYFLGISGDAKSNIYETALLTVSKDALIQKAAEAGVDPNELGLTIASAREKLFLTNTTLGDSIREFLPYVRVYLTVIFIAFAPILILVGLATGNIIRYASTAVFLALFPVFWGGVGAVTNFVISHQLTYLKDIVDAAKLSSPTFNIEDYPYVVSALKEWLTIAGWAGSAVIILSLAIMTGSAYAFVRFAGGFVSGLAGAASGTAGGIAMGNISAGNVSTDNVSANNTSMNKWDSTSIFSSGYQLSNRENISNQHIFDNENIYKNKQVSDTGTTNIRNGVNTALAGSRGAGYSTTAGTGESGGKTYTYGHNIGNTKQTNDGVTYVKNDTGSKTITAQKSAGTSLQGALGQQGNFSLSGGEDKRYTWGLNSRNAISDTDKYSLNLDHSDRTLAGVEANLNLGGRGGGKGAGGGAPSTENLPAGLKGLVKRGTLGILNLGNLNAGVRGVSEQGQSVNTSHGGSRDRSVGTGEDFNIAEALSKRYNFAQNASFNRTGNLGLTGNEVFSDGMAYGKVQSTGENRIGTDSRQAGENIAYSEQAHFREQANRTAGFRGTTDVWSLVVENAKRQGIYDSLVAAADRIVSQDPATVRANAWLAQAAPPEQMEMLKIQQAYSMSPEFQEIISNLAEGKEVKQLFAQAENKLSEYDGEVREKSKEVNPDVLNQNLKNEVVHGKNEYAEKAEQLRKEAKGEASGLVHDAKEKSDSYKEMANSYSGDLNGAEKRLTDLVNNRTGEFNEKQREMERKAKEKASLLNAADNLWNRSDFTGKGLFALGTMNAAYNLAEKAKSAVDTYLAYRAAKKLPTFYRDAVGAPIHRFEREGAESLAERLAARASVLGRGVSRFLGPAAVVAAEVLNPTEISSSEVSGTVSSDRDLQNLQPNQTARIGNTDLVIQNLGNGRYALAGHGQSQVLTEEQARELLKQHANLTGSQAEIEKQLLELARKEGAVVLNQEKLERTGSSRVVADPDRLAKLLEGED